MEMDLIRALSTLNAAFDIAFIDPPYDREDLYEAVLERFGSSAWLTPGSILVLEHSKRKVLPDSSGNVQKIRSLVQGDAALAFYSSLGEP